MTTKLGFPTHSITSQTVKNEKSCIKAAKEVKKKGYLDAIYVSRNGEARGFGLL